MTRELEVAFRELPPHVGVFRVKAILTRPRLVRVRVPRLVVAETSSAVYFFGVTEEDRALPLEDRPAYFSNFCSNLEYGVRACFGTVPVLPGDDRVALFFSSTFTEVFEDQRRLTSYISLEPRRRPPQSRPPIATTRKAVELDARGEMSVMHMVMCVAREPLAYQAAQQQQTTTSADRVRRDQHVAEREHGLRGHDEV